ncbi:DUF192 domain-containing protein [Flagellimonas nanhaiensis]|uniref:DUF192 domain-containing protein n=1 Tax=Flagellimonas nanhaiensis TaxID=2292706 RepID=A0A371JSP6_9FLAO|nr:DUF192 domain-containing protein [Allomuricauda nanhaiensis]RDY60832.1 DUF192 domain-containing protein [Allomuricauda nanhaiensis]
MKYLISCILLVLFLASCKSDSKKEIKTEVITFSKEGDLSIFKSNTDSIIARFDIEIAESDYETQTGLMYRESMEKNQGMLFIFQDVAMHSFYMKNTQIPLDIIYIDKNQKIASFQKNANPFDESGLSSQVPVKYVLEINAGISDNLGLQIGDSIVFKKN